MDLTKWWLDLLAAGLGGLIGGTVGSYFKSYWTEKGKNLATYQDIQTLLAQERGKAYEQEKGKRLATREDIENVLKEVHLVTEKTETIKATIDEKFWSRRNIWEQRRDLYLDALETINQHRSLLAKFRMANVTAGGSPPTIPQPLVHDLLTMQTKYQRHQALAKLLKLVDAHQAVLGYLTSSHFAVSNQVDRSPGTIWGEQAHERLLALETALVNAAQKDLLNE